MKRTLILERVYPHPPEKVWHALTDSQALAQWMLANNFEPVVGHRFQFYTDPAIGFDGVIHCEVLAIDPPHRLSYSWLGGWYTQVTEVTWSLEPTENGTKLRLEHTGFEGWRGILLSIILGHGGWIRMFQKLPKVLAKRL